MTALPYTLNEFEEIIGIIEDIEYVDDNILLSILSKSLNIIRVPKSCFKPLSYQGLRKGNPISIVKINNRHHIIVHSQGQEPSRPHLKERQTSSLM